MEDSRWPKAILNLIEIIILKTKMIIRTDQLQNIFECTDITLEYAESGQPLLTQQYSRIKNRVKQKQEEIWQHNMCLKSSLEIYRLGKKTRDTKSFIYDNSRGSTLLALARANMLPVKSHKMSPSGTDTTCSRCGMYEETVKHVVFECNDIYHTEDDFLLRLGLQEGERMDPSAV